MLDTIALVLTELDNDKQENVQILSDNVTARLEATRAICNLELGNFKIAKASAQKSLQLESSSVIDQFRAESVLAVCISQSGEHEKAATLQKMHLINSKSS